MSLRIPPTPVLHSENHNDDWTKEDFQLPPPLMDLDHPAGLRHRPSWENLPSLPNRHVSPLKSQLSGPDARKHFSDEVAAVQRPGRRVGIEHHLEATMSASASPLVEEDDPSLCANFTDELSYDWCSACEVTWLRAKSEKIQVSAGSSHPLHLITSDHSQRAMVVYVNSNSNYNSKGREIATVGTGIYFGPKSSYNVADAEQRAADAHPWSFAMELRAVARALEIIHTRVIPDQQNVQGFSAKDFSYLLSHTNQFCKVIVATHRKQVVRILSDALFDRQHKRDDVALFGKELGTSDWYKVISELIHRLNIAGIQVVFHEVGKRENAHATYLAKKGGLRLFRSLTSEAGKDKKTSRKSSSTNARE
ncbi:MAG: mediator complex subunit [Chaenotheca gracillima]|nr:MAG: mediator complex subunit [Chaenotheca gracillima]